MLTIASRLDVMNRLGRAMADPTRSKILLNLLELPGYPVQLARDLDLTRSNVSNHLSCLRGCGILAAVPEGRQTRYEGPAHDHHERPRPRHRPRPKLMLRRRNRLIVAVTITCNVIEAIIALAAGTMASSAALIGFGLDSIVEVLSAPGRIPSPLS